MQKQLRVGIILVALLLVVETGRLIIAAQDHINIQILAVNRPPASEAVVDALRDTPTGRSSSPSRETDLSPLSATFSTGSAQKAAASPTRPAVTLNVQPSPDPSATPTPTVTLVPYRTVIAENKPERQATEAPTQAISVTPVESSPEQPTSLPPEATSPAPTSPPASPTSAPDGLPTPAPEEPPTPGLPPLPTEAP